MSGSSDRLSWPPEVAGAGAFLSHTDASSPSPALQKTYGTKNIAGITVGNEFLLQSYGDGGVPTDAKGVAARTELLAYIQKTNTTLQALNLDKVIPLGTADAGSAVTEQLCAGCDFVMANVHPWFGSVAVDQAANWTNNFFKE